MHRIRPIVVVLVLVVAAAAVVLLIRSRAAHAVNGHATVAMDGTAFTPQELTVHVGDTVEWTNKDPFPHNVTFRGAVHARSDDLDPGGRWSFRPAAPGTFTYICTLHPGMRGVLHVQ